METEIKIQVPEGMEIDKENSTFECIKFKPKKLTYDDISKKYYRSTFIHMNSKHYDKILIFRKLLEVADYLNGDWKPDWDNISQGKYFILYNKEKNKFEINYRSYKDAELVYFSSRENALKAIEIIGEEELKQFFS